MTRIRLVCGKDGAFKSCEALGHAGYAAKGNDIVCAAETLLLRTAMQLLESEPHLCATADVSARGTLAFSVTGPYPECLKERLVCTADFLRLGLRSLAQEFPEHVLLREITE